MSKKILCSLFVLLSFSAKADELKNFDELNNAIQHGQNIHIVTFINECQSDKNSAHPPVTITGVYQPQAFMIMGDKISASDLHFTRNNPQNKDESVFEFVTYTFNADNTMQLKSQTLKAADYSPLGTARQLSCSIGSSVKLFNDASNADAAFTKK